MEDTPVFNSKGLLHSLFDSMHGDKGDLMDRCERYAGWTLPVMFPRVVNGTPEEFQLDFQSIGARAVNHLANKLTLALFAPSRPFFRVEAEDKYARTLIEQGIDDALQRTAFSRAERSAMKAMMRRGTRVAMPLAMKQIIITGNALLFFPPDGGKAQVYNLRDYCIKRDLSGVPVDMLTQDRKSFRTLDQSMQNQLLQDDPHIAPDSEVCLYTRVVLHKQRYHVYQALNEIPIEGVSGSYTKNQCPWIPVTWSLPRGYDYGVGHVEDYAGDFHAMSSLSEAMVIGASIAADIKFLVDPAGATDIGILNAASSGAYVPGRTEDIDCLQLDKQSDWNMVLGIIQQYEKRIGLAFLLGSAVTRQAERVTAEEIRYQATELETSLGGVYSRIAEDVQLPLAYIFLEDVDFGLGDGKQLEPVVITGLDALSRNSESEALLMFLQDLSMVSQLPESVSGRLELNPIIATFGAARGIEAEKYLKSEQQYQQEQQQLAQQQVSMQQEMDASKANAQATAQG